LTAELPPITFVFPMSSPRRHNSLHNPQFDSSSSLYGSSYPPTNLHSHHIPHGPQNRLPQRTTKTTTKLVLFPLDPTEDYSQNDYHSKNVLEPESPEEPPMSSQSHAERLHKSARQLIPRGNSWAFPFF
jgi:hypothetical protein